MWKTKMGIEKYEGHVKVVMETKGRGEFEKEVTLAVQGIRMEGFRKEACGSDPRGCWEDTVTPLCSLSTGDPRKWKCLA